MLFGFTTVWVVYFLANFAVNKYTTSATNKQNALVSAVFATFAGLVVVVLINILPV